MMTAISYGIVLMLALIGIVDVLYRAMIWILHPKKEGDFVIVVKLNSYNDDPASLIYAAKVRLDLLGECGKGKIIAVDMGMNDENRLRCENFCKMSHNTVFCTWGEFTEIFEKNR